jgi:hypothetical protein
MLRCCGGKRRTVFRIIFSLQIRLRQQVYDSKVLTVGISSRSQFLWIDDISLFVLEPGLTHKYKEGVIHID